MTVDELDLEFARRLRRARRARRAGFTWARKRIETLEDVWALVLATQGRTDRDVSGKALNVLELTRAEDRNWRH